MENALLMGSHATLPDCRLRLLRHVEQATSLRVAFFWFGVSLLAAANISDHSLLRKVRVCDKVDYLFERILDIKANRRHFACLSNAMDPGKCLLFKGRIPTTVNHKGNAPNSTGLNTSEAL